MSLALLIAVRFFQGSYHGREDGFGGNGGWPPSPGRLFQAMVSASAHGAVLRHDDERALKWLECLEPPAIAAPPARRGRAVKQFVPNNDLDAVGGDPARASEVRVGKVWQPYFFDHRIPLLYVWDFARGNVAEARQVCSIAERIYQLGRGIDPAWAEARLLDAAEGEDALAAHPGRLRRAGGRGDVPVPQQGTLDSLSERYRGLQHRLKAEGTGRQYRQLFTQPPRALFGRTAYEAPPEYLHFELRTQDDGFAAQPLARSAPLVSGLRDLAARRLSDALPDTARTVERLVIGRGSGPRDFAQRIRLIPIPSIGTAHTDPSIRRVVVEIPPECPIRVADLKWAFAGLTPFDPITGEAWSGRLVSTEHTRMLGRYAGLGTRFASITPVALPHSPQRSGEAHAKKARPGRSGDEGHAVSAVRQALRHAGVAARPLRIEVQREPFQVRGTIAERFARSSRFSARSLWHVRLEFPTALRGPMIIGDGRYSGLGLLVPEERFASTFEIRLGESVASKDGYELVGHLRRALMALARDTSGWVPKLFSGHESDGSAARSGHHAHVFLATDGGGGGGDTDVRRLIVAAPWAGDRQTKMHRDGQRSFDEVVRSLRELRAGRLGLFRDLVAAPLADGDIVVGPAQAWASLTPYIGTRNLKKADDVTEFLKSDLATECVRRGLPRPVQIDAHDVTAGPKGGRPRGTLSVRFATNVRGPLMLGRDSHSGAGLFHACSVPRAAARA